MEEEKGKKKVSYKRYLGYKFYLDKGNNEFEMIRIIRIYDDNTFKIMLEDGSTKNIPLSSLEKYTPLEPIGLVTFNILLTDETFDVMVVAYKLLDVKMGDNNPQILCRQGIRDFFYDICCKGDPEINNKLVGVSVSRETCPANLNINELTACDVVVDTKMVSIYREDGLNDILKCIALDPFNKIMKLNFDNHVESLPNYTPFMKERKEHHGWCKDIKTFLEINDFMEDINTMLGITGVDFNMPDYLLESTQGFKLNDIALIFFNYIFKINAVDSRVFKYDNSINLADFNNENYYIIRDNTNTLYIIVCLVRGEYLEGELEEKMKELSVSDKLRLSYHNKYCKYLKE